jgi:hypothetical protein
VKYLIIKKKGNLGDHYGRLGYNKKPENKTTGQK